MKSKIEKWFQEIFTDKDFNKKLLMIALPITFQNLVGSSLNMIDTLMIGKVGENEIAAVGLANQVFLLILMLIIGISSGTSIFISQFWGKKDVVSIRKMLGIALMGVVGTTSIATIIVILYPHKVMTFFTPDPIVINLGVQYLTVVSISYIFTAITFAYSYSLRSIGETRIPLLVSIIAVLINVVCNYIFIFGKFGAPALGVAGAALGTTIARICETIILISMIYIRKGALAAKLTELVAISKQLVFQVIKPIILVVLNELCWGLGMVVYAAAYGHISAGAAASVQISNTVASVSTVMIFGMSSAAATMVGNKIGEGKEEEGKLYAKRIATIAVMSGVVISGILALSTPTIIGAFSVSPEVARSSQRILYITAAVLVLRTFNVIMVVGIQRGGGDAKMGLIIEATTMWLVGVPMSLLGAFVLRWPVEAVVALVALEEVTKSIFCMYRFRSGKWVHNIISDLSLEKAKPTDILAR